MGVEKSVKQDKRIRKIIIWLMIAVILIVFAVLFLSGKLFNTDSFWRTFTYMNAEKDEAGLLNELSFLNQADNAFADYNGGLAVASHTGAEIIDMNGELVASESVSLKSPAVETVENRAVFYDIGGGTLFVLDKGELSLFRDDFGSIITASLNAAGYLTVVAGESGFKASVTIFDGNLAEKYKIYISSGYVITATLSADSKFVIVAMALYGESGFETRLARYNLNSNSEEPVAEYTVSDSLVFEIGFLDGDRICALTEKSAVFLDSGLEHIATYSFGSRTIKYAGMSEAGYIALLLNEQKSGNQTSLVTLDMDGEALAELRYNREILDLRVNGRYIAVLYSDSADIFDSGLELYSSAEKTVSARSALMRADGTLMLISADSARLFIS